MSKVSSSSWTLALALSQAVWVLPGAREAVAHPSGDPSCYLPPYSLTLSPCVPHDVPAGPAATVAQLAAFAWQEFVALNWVAADPASTGTRGRANTLLDPDAGFLGIAPDASGSYPLLVWQTYRHKNELFPADGQTEATFDSALPPTYKYATQPTPTINGPIPSFNLFNNLDETSQIGLDNMYAYATSDVQPKAPLPATGTRVAYEAKVNRAVYEYAQDNGFLTLVKNPTTGTISYPKLDAALGMTSANLDLYGGICSSSNTQIFMLPCGDITKAGDEGEGAIEIKAAWRKLQDSEVGNGKFFTRNVIYYTNSGGKQFYNNEVWGLVALHIIHKTKSFPGFVFATWEQTDNYDDTASPPANTQNLAFQNTGTDLENIPVTRVNPIHSQVAATNVVVHNAFKAVNPNSVWLHYELIGVQATPVAAPPPATASADDLSYYYLANIMVETNQTLQNFHGAAPEGTVIPFFPNVMVQGQGFEMGGCQGCHGFQAQYGGGDMSRLFAAADSNTLMAESINAGAAQSIRTYRQRSRSVSIPWKSRLEGVSRWQYSHGTSIPDSLKRGR